jgi:O-antigen ligase
MSAATVRAPGVLRTRDVARTEHSSIVAFLFLAALFVCTFEKVHWEVAGTVRLSEVLAILFVVAFARERIRRSDRWAPHTVAVLGGFLAAFLLVYLAGFYSLATKEAATQFGKGLVTWAIQFAFLLTGVAYLARRGESFFWKALGWFVAGIAFNAVYGVVQLADAKAGGNLDQTVLSPLTGGASSINLYGAVNGSNIYRPNALTGDPNHLGIVLVIPLLVLLPIYLRLERRHRLRLPLAVLLGFLLVMEIATLSRSGMLGLAVGLLLLVPPYRHLLVSRRFLALVAGVTLLLVVVVLRRLSFFETVIRTRLHTSSSGSSVHVQVYGFIPQVLHMHPLLGLGYNNFSVYYEFVSGQTNWGPHSFYVALFVETGLVGAALFGLFLWYVFRRLHAARELGRALAQRGEPVSARVRPLAWGLTAALVGTMVSNVFYLTMTFDYFYAFLLLVLATPVVFARRLSALRVPSP